MAKKNYTENLRLGNTELVYLDADGHFQHSTTPNGPTRTLGAVTPIRTITATGALSDADHTVLVDATGGAVVATLPTAVGRKGQEFILAKIDASANTVTLASSGGNVNGGASAVLPALRFAAFTVKSDGTNWWAVATGVQAGGGGGGGALDEVTLGVAAQTTTPFTGLTGNSVRGYIVRFCGTTETVGVGQGVLQLNGTSMTHIQSVTAAGSTSWNNYMVQANGNPWRLHGEIYIATRDLVSRHGFFRVATFLSGSHNYVFQGSFMLDTIDGAEITSIGFTATQAGFWGAGMKFSIYEVPL